MAPTGAARAARPCPATPAALRLLIGTYGRPAPALRLSCAARAAQVVTSGSRPRRGPRGPRRHPGARRSASPSPGAGLRRAWARGGGRCSTAPADRLRFEWLRPGSESWLACWRHGRPPLRARALEPARLAAAAGARPAAACSPGSAPRGSCCARWAGERAAPDPGGRLVLRRVALRSTWRLGVRHAAVPGSRRDLRTWPTSSTSPSTASPRTSRAGRRSPRRRPALLDALQLPADGGPGGDRHDLVGATRTTRSTRSRAATCRPATAGDPVELEPAAALLRARRRSPTWSRPRTTCSTGSVSMRLVAALLAALTTLFVFLFLREVFAERWTWTVGALAVAFQPLFGFISGAVHAGRAAVHRLGGAVLRARARVPARADGRARARHRAGAGGGRAREAELPRARARRAARARAAGAARRVRAARRCRGAAPRSAVLGVAAVAYVASTGWSGIAPPGAGASRRPPRDATGGPAGAAPASGSPSSSATPGSSTCRGCRS